jgi:hypothetical protein
MIYILQIEFNKRNKCRINTNKTSRSLPMAKGYSLKKTSKKISTKNTKLYAKI